MSFDPAKVNWEDPRIAPHLQTIADESFASMLQLAVKNGVPIAGPYENAPFDMMDEAIGNTWKACIISFLEALMPQEKPHA